MEFEDRPEQEHEEEAEEEDDEDEHMRTNYDSLGRTSSRPSEPPPPPPPATPPPAPPRYRECLKNHAVGLGVHAVDGCGEFIAAGAEGTLDALKCAACNCHRNFHRKEINGASSSSSTVPENNFFHGGHYLHHHYPQFTPYYRPPPPSYLHVAQPQLRPLALPSKSGGGQSQEDQEDVSNISDGKRGSSRKRFRTKFSEEQKEKMFEASKKLGWRIQKHDEDLVEELCNEIGIKRHVFKVWMHNNKHTLGKKP